MADDEQQVTPDSPEVAGLEPDTGRLLMGYVACRDALFKAFGYVERGFNMPVCNRTDFWWRFDSRGRVIFGLGDVEEAVNVRRHYVRLTCLETEHLLYQTATHTMISHDMPGSRGPVLSVFDNAKEVTDPKLVGLLLETSRV